MSQFTDDLVVTCIMKSFYDNHKCINGAEVAKCLFIIADEFIFMVKYNNLSIATSFKDFHTQDYVWLNMSL